MTGAACLANARQAHIAFAGTFDHDAALTLLAPFLLAFFRAVVAAPLVLRRYDGLVRRLMQLQQVAVPQTGWMAKRTSTVSALGSATSPRSANAIAPASLEDLQRASRSRLAVVRRATWIAYGVFVVFSLVVLASGGTHTSLEWIGYFTGVAVLAAVPALVNVRPQGSKRVLLAGMLLLAIVMLTIEPQTEPTTPADAGLNLLIALFAFAGFYFMTAHRKLRSVIVPLTVLVSAGVAGFFAAYWLVSLLSACVGEQGTSFELSLAGGGVALLLLIFAGFVCVGVRALDGIARMHERGVLSDISLVAAAGLGYIALLFAFGIGSEGRAALWRSALLTIAWMGSALTSYAWFVRGSVRSAATRSLLVLRVFSKSAAAENLLDAVQTEWRYVGPVYQIGGPDLARLNVDPYEFVKFATSRLHELFLLGAHSDDELLARLDRAADREGRFRVNEVFCLETVWRATVEQLMKLSDAILLDVRGFSADRHGTSFEVGLLARTGLLRRVVAIGDATTDWNHFDALVRAAGASSTDGVRQQIVRKDGMERCLAALLQVAAHSTTTDQVQT